MKLDNELINGHSTPAHGPDSQHYEYNDNAVENGKLKADNEIMREDKKGIVFHPKIKNWELDTKPLQTEEEIVEGVRNLQRSDDFVDMVDSINGKESKIVDSFTPYSVPASAIKLSEEESEFYTDKRVTKYELPELVVCFKEEDYHVVKDICVDDGLPSLDNSSEENGDVPNERLFGFLQLDLDVRNSDWVKEKVNAAAPNSEVMSPSVVCNSKTGVANQCDSEDLIEKGDGDVDATDKVVNSISADDAMPENLHVVLESKKDIFNTEPSNLNGNEGQQQFDQVTNSEAISENSMVPPPAEESDICKQVNELPFNGKEESETITCDFDSTVPTTSGREEEAQNLDFQQHFQTLSMPSIEEGTVESRTVSSRSFFIQPGHGESSFSTVGPLSGRIAYSGPISYSGSISLRSDSSTTSTRSFAFPILHSEWNSSPVKMAKANRRHSRKHRGWRFSLLCCRF